jgi:hypothetical protein
MDDICRAAALTHRRNLLCAAATIAALTLTACGGSSPAKTSPPTSAASNPATSASSGSSSTTGGSVADGIGHPVNVCALLPVATVAQVTNEAVTVGTEDDTLSSSKIYDCTYTSTDGTASVTVDVKAQNAVLAYNGDLAANGSGAHPIAGLGDKAFSAITGVEALFGNVVIVVSNLQSDAAAESLIRDVQPQLQ